MEKKYLFKTKMDGVFSVSIETANEIADFYEVYDNAGLFSDFELIEVWDIEEDPKKISIIELVKPILEHRRWIDAEYRSYCENEG